MRSPRATVALPYPCCAGGCGRPVGPFTVLCYPCGALVAMTDPFPFAAPTRLVDATMPGGVLG
jgi:hypothetical protein